MGMTYDSAPRFRLLLMAVFIGCLIISPMIYGKGTSSAPLTTTQLTPQASTNPSAPDTLLDDVAVPESYNAGTDYYYQAEAVSPSYYHVIWAIKPGEDITLTLYADSEYSSAVAVTMWEFYPWLVTRPSSTQTLYIKSYPWATGTYYIEWEDSSTRLQLGDSVLGSVGAAEFIETYGVSLSNAGTYTFNLTVPGGGDFALFLYYLAPGESSDGDDYVKKSDSAGIGIDEVINYGNPSMSGEYVLLIVWRSGSGTYALEFTGTEPENEIPIHPLFIIIGILGACLVYFHKRRPLPLPKLFMDYPKK